jgi:hypothetical protein
MPIVYATIEDPSGNPLRRAYVEARVAVDDATHVYRPADEVSLVSRSNGYTDSNGRWELDLAPNEDLTPANTVYEVIEAPQTGRFRVSYILVPDEAGPLWLEDLLVDPPQDLPDPVGEILAADVTFAPAGTIEATDVQAAILEAASEGGSSGPTIPMGVVTTDADYTVQPEDRWIVVDSSVNQWVIITLPDADPGAAVTIIRTDEVDEDGSGIQVNGTSVSQINGRQFTILMEGAFEFVCVDGTTWRCASSPFDFIALVGTVAPNVVFVPRWESGGFGGAQWTVDQLSLQNLMGMEAVSPSDGQVLYWESSIPGWSTKSVPAYIPLNNFSGDVGIGDESSGIFLVDTDGAPRTVTLPTAMYGLQITIKKVDTSADSLTITTLDGALIDGEAAVVLDTPYQSRDLVCDGTNWWLV